MTSTTPQRKRPHSDAVATFTADIPKPLKVKKWGGEAAREAGLLDALPQTSEVERPKKKRRVIDSDGATPEDGRREGEQEIGAEDDEGACLAVQMPTDAGGLDSDGVSQAHQMQRADQPVPPCRRQKERQRQRVEKGKPTRPMKVGFQSRDSRRSSTRL